MEVLGNVDLPQDSRGQTTRDRAFDFNLFAAELFSRVDVRKSYSADQTEGGLAGTVGLFSARPFDNKGFRAAIGGQLATNSLTRDVQPRVTALISLNWGDIGILLSGAYSRRQTREEGFDTYRWRLNNATGSNISKLSSANQARPDRRPGRARRPVPAPARRRSTMPTAPPPLPVPIVRPMPCGRSSCACIVTLEWRSRWSQCRTKRTPKSRRMKLYDPN